MSEGGDEQTEPSGYGEGTVQGASRLTLYYHRRRPEDGPPRGVLVVVHGLDTSPDLYACMVDRLVPRGYAVYSFNHREQGRSPGQRGYLKEWAKNREDVRRFLQLVQEWEPDVPIVLLGIQLGGQIVQAYALHEPEELKGVIAIDPTPHLSGAGSRLMKTVKLLSRAWPGFTPVWESDGTPELEDSEGHGVVISTESPAARPGTSDLAVPLLLLQSEGGNEQVLSALETWLEKRL